MQWPGVVSIFHGYNWQNDERYVTAIKEAGFGAAGATEAQIDHCRKQGMKAFVFAWPQESVVLCSRYKDDPAVLAYYMADRLRPNKWGVFTPMEADMFKGDPHHPAIFTMYALIGHIGEFVPTVKPRALEFYHHHWDARRSPQMRYAILEQYREEACKAGGIPTIELIQAMQDDVRKTRQTAYTSLAYGTRGLRWWGGQLFFDVNQRDERGVPRRTPLGDEVAKINAAVKAYEPVFAHSHCVSVIHAAPLPPGTKETPSNSWVKLSGDEVMAGIFENSTKSKHLLVANRDAFNAHEATLHFTGKVTSVEQMNKASGKWQPLHADINANSASAKVSLEPGGGEMLQIEGIPDSTFTSDK
ncbi:MAG: hypothetical protein K8T25_12745 [Planctomycetia bacterium]|nr:hypothetical protein [Planctomycetia bacterium]